MDKKITAIICEYNPMHTGHIYLINQAKELTKSDFTIGLMSGNFSERSEPCLLNKYSRAKIACENGLDLVLNLPTAFCTNNAEIFALSSIKILNELKVDYLAFGVETKNQSAFFELAKFLNNEPKSFKNLLKNNLKNGNNYNQILTETIINNPQFFSKENFNDIQNILTKPNNVLALEYIKAILKTKSNIEPVFVERIDNYNDENNIVKNFVSSSFLRKNLLEKNYENIKNFVAENSLNLLAKTNINYELWGNIILYKIKTENIKKLKQIYSVNEGLENKLKNEASLTNCFNIFYNNLLTKRYKQNKINSILLNSVLGIDKKTIKKLYKNKKIYVKALAVNKNSKVLSSINTKYLILRKNDLDSIKFDKFNKKLIDVENKANCLYNLIANDNLLEQDFYNKMR